MFWIDSHRCKHKNSPWVQQNTHFKSNDFSAGEGWVLRRSAQAVRDLLWEASHSEGVTGRCPLRTRRAPRAFLGIALYRVSRRLTFVISDFPSWSQSTWCNPDIWTGTTQLQYYPDGTVRTFTKQVWLQASRVSDAVRLTGPTHCSCTKTRKVPSCPNSLHTSELLLQCKQEYSVGWFSDHQVWGSGCTTRQGLTKVHMIVDWWDVSR